ncbi:MAG: hypothetical protein Q4B58_06235 [Bacteroidales bacterium]|nr:hypothetical protein [Bacteroidales bacterium]
MDNVLLTNIVETINEHQSWISATIEEHPEPYHIRRGGSERLILGRAIHLTAYRDQGNYTKGQKWIIHEYLLNQSVRKLRAFDPIFAHHFAKRKLTLKEIERVIADSSGGFAKLDLCPYGYW